MNNECFLSFIFTFIAMYHKRKVSGRRTQILIRLINVFAFIVSTADRRMNMWLMERKEHKLV